MSAPAPTPASPLSDSELERLQHLLDAVPAPLEPLDVSALDGYLAGVLLQPRPVPAEHWLRWVTDVEGRPAPAGPALDELQALVRRRHAELDRAIARRDWFDPWIFPLDETDEGEEEDQDQDNTDDATTQDAVLPWVAGFAAAMDAFPALMDSPDPALIEPLALLYLHFDPEDLEDADALLAVIETLEPPADLAEAVQDLVRALMLMADVTRPQATKPGLRPRGGGQRKAPGKPAPRGRR
jgi:uncharacterized protein